MHQSSSKASNFFEKGDLEDKCKGEVVHYQLDIIRKWNKVIVRQMQQNRCQKRERVQSQNKNVSVLLQTNFPDYIKRTLHKANLQLHRCIDKRLL